ncbi:stAR-related lipid transfer protein 9 isoform X7 [Papio anubis]|uniref:stAR-related lipid transfer protein 9 isoform X7 n=1 Tax=Papio anubis TaxID=9555 RepID=UPI0012AD8510|nr:stAR-related lipid transfer protein 9 isoform X7 [Papio anubis]
MANVRVAVRVRPLSKRETKEGGRIIVEVDGKVAKIRNLKVDSRPDGFGDSREKVMAFGFDYCYWSVNPEDPQYASQDVVFQDLGMEVLSGVAKGYNICLFAYGQTGSGKTYTMLGTPASVGLTPRICEGLFIREKDCASLPSSCRIKVSFLEIYNERVRDLLKQSGQKKPYTLRVREHPEMGPYVQGLSQHVVTNYKQVIQLLEEGIANRITAATHVHEASSRSHAIFTIHYTQAILENNLPSEMASKINLVDLAGSERADPSYCKDRITEGANINKSLVTLGIVISTLAQNSQVFSSCQSLNSSVSNGGDSGILSSPSGTSSGGAPSRRQSYIPYRDSVLTWLLKDSLGGNSKTIMVATVSPAHTSYSETMSTLRYASSAKNIINKPRVNEDANVKLIRELREEIERLKALLLSFELRNFGSLNDEKDENLKELVLQNELKIDQLTKDWTQKWNDWQALMEHYSVDINRRRAGVVIDSSLPHLMALEDDVLSTGVVLYHLKEGTTKIGRIDSDQEQDIVLQGQWIERDHCTITSACGVVVLRPARGARCTVNGREVTASCRLTQGAVITLGKAQKFRFNHPAEAAVLRQRRQVGEAAAGGGSLEWLDLDGDLTASRLGLFPLLWKEGRALEEQCDEDRQPPRDGETSHRAQIQQQQSYVEDLRHQILAEEIQAEKELEFDQSWISQQIKENQQCLLREETWLASLQQQQQEDHVAEKELEASVALDAWLQTDPEIQPSPFVQSQKRVVQLQLLRRHTLRAAERNVRRKKVSFQLERIIKKQRLLEAQKRLEQLTTLCWLQDDSTQEPPYQVPSPDATVPRPQCRSKLTSCSSLSPQRLCSKHVPQLHSIFLSWDPSTTLPPMPDPTHQTSEKTSSEECLSQAASYPPRIGCLRKNGLHSSGHGQPCTARAALSRKGASAPDTWLTVSPNSVGIQEMERVGKQPHQMVIQGLASLRKSANKLKPRHEPKILTSTTQTRGAKGLADPSHTQAGWRKEGNLGTHTAAKGASGNSPYPHGPRQTAGHGKAVKTFWTEYKPPSLSRASKRHQRVLAARVRNITKKSSHLPLGSPLKRQQNTRDLDTMAPLTDFSPVVDHSREDNDFSDSDSNYSVDSLSCVYTKALIEPLKPEDPQERKWDFPEPENSESDDSQISEDSLAEKRYQSPQNRLGGNHPTNHHGHPRTRARASVRGFIAPSDSDLLAQTHRSFSLDSLIDAEEELAEDQQEEPFPGSADEIPTETFWHLEDSNLPVMDQEAICRLGPINYRTAARLDAVLPMSSSFYLDPQFQPRCELQPHCEQAESQGEPSYSEQANSLQGMQLSRESPLMSMDSWFSCDSKINPSSPPGIVGSLCPSPDVQEFHHCKGERPGYWLNTEELKPSDAETVLPYSSKLHQGSTELLCIARDEHTASASDTSRLSLWGIQKLIQPGADGTFQGRCIHDTTQQGSSEASHNSSVSNVLSASATTLTHVGGTHERDWSALQQKCLLELSHPVLEAIGAPRPAFPYLEEDSGSLAQASGEGGDTSLPVGPKRMKALTRALPLQPRLERSSENNGQLVKASASLKEQPWGLGSLEELETVKGFQESQVAEHLSSSNQEEPKAQGKVEEMPMQRRRSLQEENKVTQKLPSLSQLCRDTFFSQETVSPLLSWTEFSTAPPHQDLSNTLPLNSPRRPRSCLHVPGVLGISSLDCVLDLTMLKIHNSPLVTGVHHQDQSTETRGHSPEGNVRGGSSEAHTAWCGSVRSMAMRSHSQSGVPESISLGTEDKISASTSPQDHGKDLRITLLGFSTSEDFASEAEVAVQKEIGVSSLNKVSSQPEKRVSFSLEKDNDQASKPRQKAEKETEDLGLTSSVSLAPVSLPRVPSLEPRLLEPSDYASMCLAILEEIRQAKAQRKQLNDFVARGTVLSYCETLLEPECPSGVAGGPQCKQIELSSSDQTRNEGEAPGFHVASLSAEAGQTDLSTDERKVQATPLSADSFQSLPNTETDRQPWDPMQAFSHAAPALDKKHCAGELRQFAGTSEPFICHSGSFEILEKKKDATRTPSSVDPLAPDSLLSSAPVEGVRRVVSKQVVAALSSQAPCDDPRVTLHELSQSVPQETAEGIPAGSQDSSPEHQEPRALNTTYGEVSGNSLVTAQEEKTAHFESQSVTCDVQNSTSPSGPKQDHVQCPEASTGFEEGRANPKQDTVLPGALTGVELEAPTQQCVKWKESVGSGLTEICRAGSKHSRPTPLPDQRPSPNPEGIGEGAPCRYPREALHGPVFSRNPEGSRTLSASRGKESRTLPCRQPCSSQPVATRSYSCHSSTLLCCRGGDLGKEPFKAALRTVYPPCGVPSRAYEMDETGETSSRGPDVLLTHGLEPRDVNREFSITESSTCEPSTVAAILSGAQGCRSPSASDVRRTSSFSHSATDGSLGLIGAPEKKVAENQASTELEATSFPAGMYSEPLRQFRDSSVGDQNAQVSQTSPEPPATTPGPHTLDLSEGSVESKLVAEPRHECFENTTRCFLEKPQFSTELRDHDCLDSQAKFVARLKHTCSPQEDSRWQEEEQHRDQASGGGEGFTQGMNPLPSDEGGLDSCQILDTRRQEVAVAKPPVSKILSQGFKDPATVSLRQNETPQPVSQGPGNLYTGREQPALNHRGSLPMTAIFSGPERSKSSPTPQISVVSSSRSLQELNLSVEPPSPTDEDTQGPDRLWNPHLRGYSTGKSMARTSLQAEDSNQKASSHLDDGITDHRPLKPATPPYPVPSTLSHMPTPDFMTSWMSGTLEQGQQGKPEKLGVQVRPENWCSQMDKGMLHFGSSDISPYALPWRPEEHARIGWKQYVFGSTVDVSCSQKPQGLTPSNVARCSSMDNGLEDQNSPLHSHLSTYANILDLSTTHSSTENAQGSNEAWEVFPGSSSVSLGDPHILTSSEGVAPTLGHDRRPQFRGPSGEADCLRSKPPLAEGSAAGPADEIMLPYPSGAGCPVGQTRMNIFEQGTQTLGSRCHQSSTDISFAQPEATAASASDLASWTSMHTLSLHLSQLLHSTSELLGSLSQPGVARREQNTKRDIPDKAPQALMMDGSTQTTVDEGSQTDLTSPTLRLQASEAEPQGANVILEGLGSHTSTVSQEEGDVPGVPQKREAEETAQKMAQLMYLQEESTPYKPQNPSTPSSHLRFQKAPLRQHLPSMGPSVSDAFLPPSSQPEESSCIAVSSPSPSPCHSPGLLPSTSEYPGDPRVQKKLGPTSALLVDRASSPILTLSASTQELGLPPGSLTLSAPSAHPVEGHQKLDSSPDPVGAPRTPMDNYSQTTDELGGSQRGGSVLQRSNGRSFLELHSPHNPQQSPKLQFSFLGQHPQQLQPSTTIGVQSRLLPPPLRHRSQMLADSFVPEEVASLERGPLSGREPSQWRSRTENGGESSASPGEPQRTLDRPSSCGGLQHLSPCPVSELTDTAGLRGSALGLPQACQPEGLLCSSCQMCMAPEPQHHSLRDLPAHNKFSNWCGVQKGSPGGVDMTEEELGASGDLSSEKQEQSTPQPPNDHSQDPEWSQGEQIPLQVGAQNLSLSVELTEAKLHHGFGEADALLQVLQSGTGEALAADEPVISTWKELHARQKKAIETLRRERAERLGNFCRTRSLSPQKQLSLLPNKELFVWDLDLPSRRREYLQQLRKDVVETTRSPESVSRSAQPPSDIELMLRDYQQAHEEAKEEIARARDQLREQTEQEKLRIHQQIVSQLLREEDKLHTLANSSSLCTSSNGSLSSGMTSGYNSSPALSGQLQSPENAGYTNLPDSRDVWIGDERGGLSAVRKNSAYGRRASLGSCCCSPSSLSNSGTCFSSSYQDLAKHVVDTSMADVMAACSDNLHNLFSCQATAGWNYQGEEQAVQLYYKVFSSTRHGFLGAGVVSQPLSHVWAAVSDPSLWPLYYKPIQTARLHQRVTNSISLVYLVCNTTLCALKQPRDFCCVCVEAKEVPALVGHLSVMAAQSVYDTSMPRPSRKMVRGEILPSAWILQPVTVEGKEVTRVIYLAQVELGAPGFPPQLLSSFIKQQPLVIARLASFLGS